MLSRRADLVSCNSLLYGSSGRCLRVLHSSGAVLPNPAIATFVTFAPLGKSFQASHSLPCSRHRLPSG
jgi:hypothetical protein